MEHSAVRAGDITGGIIGGLAVLAGAGVMFYFTRRPKREEEEEERATDRTFQPEPLLLDEIEGENPLTLASTVVNSGLEAEDGPI
jgi:hypothetical protein